MTQNQTYSQGNNSSKIPLNAKDAEFLSIEKSLSFKLEKLEAHHKRIQQIGDKALGGSPILAEGKNLGAPPVVGGSIGRINSIIDNFAYQLLLIENEIERLETL